MTSLTPTPENLVHITVCNCETKCITNRTKCRKNGLNCSEMCGYESCKNGEKDDELYLESQAVNNWSKRVQAKQRNIYIFLFNLLVC